MKKKKILVAYYSMMVGGSTTSLLSFLGALDKEKYEIDLLLYKNEGEFLDMIPKEVRVLPEAFQYANSLGRIIKLLKGILGGYLLRAWLVNRKHGEPGFSEQILSDFQALQLSRKLPDKYEYAVGYMEGWSDRYVTYRVNAGKKYCWLHSTFAYIAPVPELEKRWMKNVDKIVCVSENCRADFCKVMPEFSEKSITIENISNSDFIKKQGDIITEDDNLLKSFLESNKFKIISVCRLAMETKGLDRIIFCAKNLKKKNLSFVWYIVGDGDDRKKLEDMIVEYDLSQEVILTGKRSNPYPFLGNADVMCMPSRWEGKPMTVSEAMILGTPCVVTEYLSAKEQIMNRVNGIIVENNDTAIQEAILECIENRELLNGLKDNLKQNVYGNREYIEYVEGTLFS